MSNIVDPHFFAQSVTAVVNGAKLSQERRPLFQPRIAEVGLRIAVLAGSTVFLRQDNKLARTAYFSRVPGAAIRHGLPLRGEWSSCGFKQEKRELLPVRENNIIVDVPHPGLYIVSQDAGGFIRDYVLVAFTAAQYRTIAPWSCETPHIHQAVAGQIINDPRATLRSLSLGLEDPEFAVGQKEFPRVFGDCSATINVQQFCNAPGWGQDDQYEQRIREAKAAAAEKKQLLEEQARLEAANEAKRAAKFSEVE